MNYSEYEKRSKARSFLDLPGRVFLFGDQIVADIETVLYDISFASWVKAGAE